MIILGQNKTDIIPMIFLPSNLVENNIFWLFRGIIILTPIYIILGFFKVPLQLSKHEMS